MEIPSNWKRNELRRKTGEIWLDRYFTYEEREREIRKFHTCKECGWKSYDLDNRGGNLKKHIKIEHGFELDDYLDKYPDELSYFKKDARIREFESNPDNWVECLECGGKYTKISNSHLSTHGMTKIEYMTKYNLLSKELMTKEYLDACIKSSETMNLALEGTNRFISKNEMGLGDYIESLGVDIKRGNRTILNSKEVDIVIPNLKIGIEYSGCQWHSEWFGKKNRHYHIDKTLLANKEGYGLIQIFDDEYIGNEELIHNKIKHILGKNDSPILHTRKLVIKTIKNIVVRDNFLNKYHIQGKVRATITYGAYHNDELVAVMCFKILNKKENNWDLVRFATNYNYRINGIANKLLKHFIKENNPDSIISFADRRWTLDGYNNLYTKLGFDLVETLAPDYRYYKSVGGIPHRFHKFGFRTQTLHKKYGLDLNLTETEMVKILGYDRIWDCGLFKYKMKLI